MSSKGTPKWVSGEEAKARKLNPPVEGKDSLITRVQYTKAPDAGEVQQLGFINRCKCLSFVSLSVSFPSSVILSRLETTC